MAKVLIRVEGGMVQGVYAPRGVEVEVRDYDVDTADKEDLTEDSRGDQCVVTEWSGGSLKDWPKLKETD